MRALLRIGLLLGGLLLVVPFLTAQAPKGKGGNASDEHYKKIATMREVTGKIISCSETNVTFRIEIQVPQMTNPPRPNPVRPLRPGQRPQPQRPPQIRFTTEYMDFDLPLAPEAKIRTNLLPMRFDEKGDIKQYTAKEKQELKGKDNLPGYATTAEDLRNGQLAKLTLVRPKGNINAKDANLDEIKPSVSMILVVQDGTEIPGTVPKKK